MIPDELKASAQSEQLCEELEKAANTGDAVGVSSLLLEYKNNPQKYDSDMFNLLVGNALWVSCEMGHVECVKLLQPLSRPTDMFHAIMGACNYGHQKVVEFLLTVYTWENAATKKDALLCAVSSGSVEMAKYMLTHATHKKHRNEALGEASTTKNQEMFDLLYPLSNPQAALDLMDKNPEATDDDKSMLRDEIAHRQNLAINKALGTTPEKPVRKNKI